MYIYGANEHMTYPPGKVKLVAGGVGLFQSGIHHGSCFIHQVRDCLFSVIFN